MGASLDIPQAERDLDERIAVLRRYRRMLEMQRERLQDYLVLLDTREIAVKEGNYLALEEYTVKEQHVIKGILAVQKCLKPLAEMYQKALPEGSRDIDELTSRLENLRQKVLVRNEESRALLKSHALNLKTELDSLKIPRSTKSVFAQNPEPRLIDVMT